MLEILNLKEAEKWTEENLYEADLYLFPLEVAVKNGLLVEIDKGYYAVRETECNGCTWVIDSVRKLTDEEMKANNLCLRYRYSEHVTEKPDGYQGVTEMNAGFDLPENKKPSVTRQPGKNIPRSRSL